MHYPPDVPTHSPTQELHFDATGRLVRHDYTAEVVGSLGQGGAPVPDYRKFGGLWLPTTRRVFPRGPANRCLPLPTLVAIDIHNARPLTGDCSAAPEVVAVAARREPRCLDDIHARSNRPPTE